MYFHDFNLVVRVYSASSITTTVYGACSSSREVKLLGLTSERFTQPTTRLDPPRSALCPCCDTLMAPSPPSGIIILLPSRSCIQRSSADFLWSLESNIELQFIGCLGHIVHGMVYSDEHSRHPDRLVEYATMSYRPFPTTNSLP